MHFYLNGVIIAFYETGLKKLLLEDWQLIWYK